MSNEKELQVDDLETVATETVVTKEKKVKAAPTAEDIAALVAGVEKIKEFGVSDSFAKVLGMVPMWHDTEANKATKEAIIAELGGPEKFKDYVDSEFQTELAVIGGLSKIASTLNNIKSFYARREPKAGSRKVKTTQVNMGGKFYLVNSEYYASLKGLEASEKRDLLLAHEDTKENDAIEIL